jgi:hypothetical protein
VAHTRRDGVVWSDATTFPDPLGAVGADASAAPSRGGGSIYLDADGPDWDRFRPGEPGDTLVDGVAPSAAGDRWWGVGLWEWSGGGNMTGQSAVLTSEDLVTWEPVWLGGWGRNAAHLPLNGIVSIDAGRAVAEGDPPPTGRVTPRDEDDRDDAEPQPGPGVDGQPSEASTRSACAPS